MRRLQRVLVSIHFFYVAVSIQKIIIRHDAGLRARERSQQHGNALSKMNNGTEIRYISAFVESVRMRTGELTARERPSTGTPLREIALIGMQQT